MPKLCVIHPYPCRAPALGYLATTILQMGCGHTGSISISIELAKVHIGPDELFY